MGLRQIVDREDGRTVLYDSVSEVALPPVFISEDEAFRFMAWYNRQDESRRSDGGSVDLRAYSPVAVMKLYERFLAAERASLVKVDL